MSGSILAYMVLAKWTPDEVRGSATANVENTVLKLVPPFVIGLFILPITAGLIFTVLPAFGVLSPDVASTSLFQAWHKLCEWPGLGSSLRATFVSGFGATFIAFALALAITATFINTRAFVAILRMQLPFLALPHAALAVGLGFLIAPSGWIARLISPLFTGWTRPPDLLITNDSLGLSLMVGLIIKELPFLLMMVFTALNQVKHRDLINMSRALGYKPATAFWLSVFPQVYRQIRLPIFAVLAYSLSVVDMSLILGPGNPPTFAVQILKWFSDSDFSLRPLASAASVCQLFIILWAIGFWILGEKLIKLVSLKWSQSGVRNRFAASSKTLAWSGLGLSVFLASFSLLTLLIWTFAKRWRFPADLPTSWSLKTWMRSADFIWEPLAHAICFAFFSALLALLMALLCLEHEQRRDKRISKAGLVVLYLPLLIPQISFLFGVKVLAARYGQDGLWWTLLWSHLIFVVPYMLLTLSEPFHAIDKRYIQIGYTLGRKPWAVFWHIKLPLILPSILFASALGFAVSFTQYLPTLMLGAGRFPTLTTEAVALAAGADRRVLAVYAVLQAAIPLSLFLVALALGRRSGGRIIGDVE
ncbi:MAG: ABC transporter permease [Alphaproteobacteria bacterium]